MLEIPALTTSKPKLLRMDRRSQAANLLVFGGLSGGVVPKPHTLNPKP